MVEKQAYKYPLL